MGRDGAVPFPSSRLTRALAVSAAGAVVAGVALVAVASQAAAVGTRYAGTPVGSLELRPASGNNLTAIDYTTSAPCPGGSSFETRVYGFGLPDDGQIVTSRTKANFSTSSRITSAFSHSFQFFAERNNTTLQGTYDVVLRCTDDLGGPNRGEFLQLVDFSSPTAYTARTGTQTPAPTASASTSTSASATATSSAACQTPTVRIGTPIINATGLAQVTIVGARPGSQVELQGYSQDHFSTANFDNDATPVDRAGTADSSGTLSINDLRPPSNTRLRARQVGCSYGSSSVINVRATQTLVVSRVGARAFVISGGSIPARPGGLIISLYRINGTACAAGVEPRNCPGEVQVGQGRADQSSGKYSIRVIFPAADAGKTVRLVVKTGQDAQNAPGRSNVRNLPIN